MKLIDEKLVEEKAKEYADPRSSAEVFRRSNIADFTAGVEFAEQQLKQKMIEFVEWCIDNHCRNNDNTWCAMESKTTEQLLGEFINKQK